MFEDYKLQIEDEYIQIGYFDEDNQFFLDQQDFKIIYKTFDKFYINKLTNIKNKKQQLTSQDLLFKPKINKLSEKIYKLQRKKQKKRMKRHRKTQSRTITMNKKLRKHVDLANYLTSYDDMKLEKLRKKK